jgi:ATP-dependent DNA helicase RecG
MSTLVDDVWQAIQNGRSTRLDWFNEQTPVTTIATTMAAMANTSGGTLLLGVVGPAASTLGVRDTEAMIDRVLQAALMIDPPLIIPMPQVLQLKGQPIIVIHLPQGLPHVYALDGRYLCRQDTDNIPLKPQELRRLIIERGEASFETEIAHSASLDDINWEKAEAYAGSLSGLADSDIHDVLIRRGCLAHHNGQTRPTNAGILLFGRDPQRHLRGAEITAARFAGETMSDTFSRQDIQGSLPDQIRRAETFLVDHLRKNTHLRHTMTREETFEYPLEAARELVVNAVAHRDYSISGDGIRLFIFRDRMEITSPGGLPGPVTVDNIKDERFSRNPVIVQVLSDMGFIERLGYGVDRVIDLMQQQKLRAPQFEETAGGFRVLLYNDQPETTLTSEILALPELKGFYQGIEINPRQEAALRFLHREGNTRITNSDLQGLCPDVHAETIRRDLADLVTKDILEKLGQKRGSYYVLKRTSL